MDPSQVAMLGADASLAFEWIIRAGLVGTLLGFMLIIGSTNK